MATISSSITSRPCNLLAGIVDQVQQLVPVSLSFQPLVVEGLLDFADCFPEVVHDAALGLALGLSFCLDISPQCLAIGPQCSYLPADRFVELLKVDMHILLEDQ